MPDQLRDPFDLPDCPGCGGEGYDHRGRTCRRCGGLGKMLIGDSGPGDEGA